MVKSRIFLINAIFFICFMCVFALFSPLTYSKPVYAVGANEGLTSARSMIVLEKNSLRVLYCFNENERLPMASTTKIITAIYVIENHKNLDCVVSKNIEKIS